LKKYINSIPIKGVTSTS